MYIYILFIKIHIIHNFPIPKLYVHWNSSNVFRLSPKIYLLMYLHNAGGSALIFLLHTSWRRAVVCLSIRFGFFFVFKITPYRKNIYYYSQTRTHDDVAAHSHIECDVIISSSRARALTYKHEGGMRIRSSSSTMAHT